MDQSFPSPTATGNSAAGACSGCCAKPDNAWVARALANGCAETLPFRHWLLDAVLPPAFLATLDRLVDATASPVANGRRETINPSRQFLNQAAIAADPGVAVLADAFENCRARRVISTLCRTDLAGTALRIEHAADANGFWLEPHTDIAAKRLTLLIYLNDAPDGEDWGTDLYDRNRMPVARAPARRNSALLFVPGSDSWHGFERRPITGLRRCLIVNYVDPGWRARHELAKG